MTALTPLFPGMPGTTEMMVILLIAVLLFGANKIPKLARSTGEAMGEFQKGRTEVEQELEEMKDGDVQSDGAAADESADETAEETSTESSN